MSAKRRTLCGLTCSRGKAFLTPTNGAGDGDQTWKGERSFRWNNFALRVGRYGATRTPLTAERIYERRGYHVAGSRAESIRG
jgi:hypothetical protein